MRLRVGNYMKKYLPGDCVIEDTRKYIYQRYYVASIEKDKEGKIWSSWVREEEIMSKEEEGESGDRNRERERRWIGRRILCGRGSGRETDRKRERGGKKE